MRGDSVRKYLNTKGLAVLDALDKVSAKYNSKPATVALAWLIAQPHLGAPIVSATSSSQLETLFAAPKLNLDKEDLDLLDKASK